MTQKCESRFRVLFTDHPWPETEVERGILEAADAELIVAPGGDEATLASLAATHQVDAIMTCWAKVTASVIAASSRCGHVARFGVGLDNIDVSYCTSRQIPVTNVPDYCLTEVAEHTIALVMALGRKVAWYHAETKQGRYDLKSGGQMRRMTSQTLGIVGFGAIGREVARRSQALGLKVLAFSRRRGAVEGVEFVEFDDLLRRSDYVSLHVPHTPETDKMIDSRALALMKPTAFLINTARGAVVDHAALAAALANNSLAGAALDVQTPEPPDLSQPPYNDPRVIVTPHAAFVSVESLHELRARATSQVVERLLGRWPANVVNLSAPTMR